MTGYFVRAAVDGKAMTIEVDELPDGALDLWAASLPDDRARVWLTSMVRWIRDNVRKDAMLSARPSDQ